MRNTVLRRALLLLRSIRQVRLTMLMAVGLVVAWQALAVAQSATPGSPAGHANVMLAADHRGGGDSHGGGRPAVQNRGGGDNRFRNNDAWSFRDRGDNDDFGLGLYVNPYQSPDYYWDPAIGEYIYPQPEDSWGLTLRF